MSESNKSPLQPPLASVEADLFGLLFEFHQKTVALLRESTLNEEQRKVVGDRIKTLLDNVTAEMKETLQANHKERLESVYDEIKQLVDQLSGIPDASERGEPRRMPVD